MRSFLLTPVALLLAPVALQAQQSAPGDAGAVTPTPQIKTKPPRQICRTESKTGSILGAKRICHTNDEWRQIDAASDGSYANDAGHRSQTH